MAQSVRLRPMTLTRETSVDDGTDAAKLPESDDQLLPSSLTEMADEMIDGTIAENLTDVKRLKNKKLISHGLLNIALFSANVNQLRYALDTVNGGAIYVIHVVLLMVSIFLQIVIGVALLLSARYKVTDPDRRKMAFRLGNVVVVGVFLVTVINIFITSFGIPLTVPGNKTTAAAVASCPEP